MFESCRVHQRYQRLAADLELCRFSFVTNPGLMLSPGCRTMVSFTLPSSECCPTTALQRTVLHTAADAARKAATLEGAMR